MNKKYVIEKLREIIKTLKENEEEELRGFHMSIGHAKGKKITGQADIYWDSY